MKRFFIFLALGCGVVIALIVAINLTVNIQASPYIYKNVKEAPKAKVVIIPGAAILLNGGLGIVFKDRVDVAIKLYEEEKVSKILVSGDNSTESHNEVSPVRNYLIEKGIPDQDIFLDHAGFDTYSTMYRARDIFHVTSAIIVTQSFHLPRAVFIARHLGITAYGVIVDSGHLPFRNYVREALANEKAVLNLLFLREPKYLGEAIPIIED